MPYRFHKLPRKFILELRILILLGLLTIEMDIEHPIRDCHKGCQQKNRINGIQPCVRPFARINSRQACGQNGNPSKNKTDRYQDHKP